MADLDPALAVLETRAPGTNLRDIMARMGHDSPRAALIYQHTTSEADQGIAATMDKAVKALRRKPSRRKPKAPESGASAA